jgi:succinate dehydrogenase/fumarate reductase flavoprotein subunit
MDAQAASVERFDVIVVGGGGSGLAAAIEARSQGRRVVLLEKNARVGGTTALSVGSISATNTPHQLRAGIHDSPRDHRDDMPLFASIDKRMGECGELAPPEPLVLQRLLADNVTDSVRWLIDKGVVFFGPMPELPHRKPRMHNIVPNSRAYIFHLERHARRIGVEIRTGHRARQLLHEGGRVTGVEVELPDGRPQSLGARGVVLASGDFSADAALKSQYLPEPGPRVPPINPASTGDGQRMAMALGARIVNGHVAFVSLRFPAPKTPSFVQRIPPYRWLMRSVAWGLKHLPQALLRPFVLGYITTFLIPELEMFAAGAILVNRNGERFVDELTRPDTPLLDQPEQCGYAIMDDTVARKFSAWPHYVSTAPGVAYAYLPDYRRNRPDLYARAATIAELAQKLGVPATALQRTVAEYNAGGGLPGGARKPLLRAPFHALGPIRNLMGYTEGGLAVNERLEVLGPGDAPIPGLFAAGATGQSGMMLMGHGHHLGWAFTSGRIAGRNAAWLATSDDVPGAAQARQRAEAGLLTAGGS